MDRIPSVKTYEIFLTIIIACAILWFIYITTPETNYNIYYMKK